VFCKTSLCFPVLVQHILFSPSVCSDASFGIARVLSVTVFSCRRRRLTSGSLASRLFDVVEEIGVIGVPLGMMGQPPLCCVSELDSFRSLLLVVAPPSPSFLHRDPRNGSLCLPFFFFPPRRIAFSNWSLLTTGGTFLRPLPLLHPEPSTPTLFPFLVTVWYSVLFLPGVGGFQVKAALPSAHCRPSFASGKLCSAVQHVQVVGRFHPSPFFYYRRGFLENIGFLLLVLPVPLFTPICL